MEKIFVIQASQGQYEDETHWIIKAYKEKSAAEAYVAKATRIYAKVSEFYQDKVREENAILENMSEEELLAWDATDGYNFDAKEMSYSGVYFRTEEIELVGTDDKVMLIGGKKPLDSITEEDAITALVAYHSEKNRYRLSRELLMGANKSGYLKDGRVRQALEKLNYSI